MHRLLCAFFLTAFCCALSAGAERSLLPDQFGGWKAASPSKTLQVRDLGPSWAKWPNGDRVLKEAGLQRIEQCAFQKGGNELRVQTFVLRDPSSAYEVYTFLLAPGMGDLGLGKDSAGSGILFHLRQDMGFVTMDTEVLILVGNLVVQASIPAGDKPESMKEWKEGLGDLKELVAALQAKADTTPFPPLKSYLPEHWKVFGSEKYALGPEAFRAGLSSLRLDTVAGLASEVGFENGAEAMMAGYRGQHGSGTLLLLDYPTPQLAEQHLHHLEQALPEELKRSGVTVERKASLLSLVFATTAPEHAQAIRDEVNYETQVTWNEYSRRATDPSIYTMMFKIFLFTGLFLGIATAVGVAFGGLRVIIKRMFPGKVFDRPQDIEVLQLGLSGKKIDPTDMY